MSDTPSDTHPDLATDPIAAALAAMEPSPGVTLQPDPEQAAELGDRADLFPPRREDVLRSVYLPNAGKRFQVAKVRPGQLAWVTNQCIVKKPDPDHDGQELQEWDATKRGFLMVAIALRDKKGRPMFPGTLDDPGQWIYGAMKVMNETDNEDYGLLFLAVNDLSGLTRRSRETAGKDSGRTPTTG